MTLLARSWRRCCSSPFVPRSWRRWCSVIAPDSSTDSRSIPGVGCELQYFHEHHRPAVPLLDWHRLLDTGGTELLHSQVVARKGVGDIKRVQSLYQQYLRTLSQAGPEAALPDLDLLVFEARRIPNRTRPARVPGPESGSEDPNQPVARDVVGEKPVFEFPVRDFSRGTSRLGMLRLDGVGSITGNRTYFFMQELAELEAALVNMTLARLIRSDFHLISVPDMVSQEVLEGCGLHVHGERTMAYRVLENEPSSRDSHLFMSGTAEVSLGSMLRGRSIHLGPDSSPRPLKLAAVSRCFRPEVSHLHSEGGVYRVHQFTKVEMFGVCAGELEHSEKLLEEFVSIQRDLFESLGLHFIVYEMPPHELGAPAYRKVDIEAWMPGRGLYGEVSSASNCTDYQARRLCIKRTANHRAHDHVHTVNGTACATPRLLTALLETHQNKYGNVRLPEVLRPFLGGRTHLISPDRSRRFIKRRHVDSYTVQLQCDHWPDGEDEEIS